MTLAKSIALATALPVFLLLVAMQFTKEVIWTRLNFAVAGTLLFGTGLACAVAAQQWS